LTRFLAVPYDFGRERTGVGLGPVRIMGAISDSVEIIRRREPFSDRYNAIRAVNAALGAAVAEA
jgi:hypothetical protein